MFKKKLILSGGTPTYKRPCCTSELKIKDKVSISKDILNFKNALEENTHRDGFMNYVDSKQYFHPQNMFICKSKKLLINYYNALFPWLEKCEEIFPEESLKGYDLTRIYGFLAERFLSYWFKKNYKYKTMPIIFYDIKKDFDHKL